jgi:hypothetical protein
MDRITSQGIKEDILSMSITKSDLISFTHRKRQGTDPRTYPTIDITANVLE